MKKIYLSDIEKLIGTDEFDAAMEQYNCQELSFAKQELELLYEEIIDTENDLLSGNCQELDAVRKEFKSFAEHIIFWELEKLRIMKELGINA